MYQTSFSKGQELVAQRMVANFIKHGHDAFLITSNYHDGKEVFPTGSIPPEKSYVYAQDTELGIPVIRVDSSTSKWPPRRISFKDFVHTLEKIVNDFHLNVLITHSTLWNGPEETAKFVEWRRHIRSLGGYKDPLVFCQMSHYMEASPKRYSILERSFRLAWNKFSLSQVLHAANIVLVTTPFEGDAQVKMGASREKCVLFPGGIDEESFAKFASLGPGEIRQRLNLQKGAQIVSYLGTIEDRKNPKAVLEVAKKLQHRKDIHFVIAGRGDSEYADEIKATAETLPNVTYLGELSEKEKIQLIKASYLNIILSRLEGIGLSQLEFMFQGTPVITSAMGGQSWLIRHNQEGIHVKGPDDVEGALQAIVDLMDNPRQWLRLSANAKNRVKEFTFSKIISDLDLAITGELEKESGLSGLPAEVRDTFTEPEQVVKTWSHGSRKVVATNYGLFIQHGWLSRRTLELPYKSINSIEHIRRYAWKTLLFGSLLSTFLFVEPYLRPIFSRTLLSRIGQLAQTAFPNIALQFDLPDTFTNNLPLIPISIAMVVFTIQARKGFALHGASIKPVYLPRPFVDIIKYIKSMENNNVSVNISSKKNDTLSIENNF
ncbi:MAG: glycosyltransferase family 4 protein [Thaumarchaeota archaeon]|nr:glycosyltransferase family 4 protein [Nitrososphaerota archaeon]